MDYDAHFTSLLEALQADTTLEQPYKNFAIADTKRLLAVIHEGLIGREALAQTEHDITPAAQPNHAQSVSEILDAKRFPVPRPVSCICSDDMPARKDCPVHGTPQAA